MMPPVEFSRGGTLEGAAHWAEPRMSGGCRRAGFKSSISGVPREKASTFVRRCRRASRQIGSQLELQALIARSRKAIDKAKATAPTFLRLLLNQDVTPTNTRNLSATAVIAPDCA